jgi:hypothetical protein
MCYLHICVIFADSEKRDSLGCECVKHLPSIMHVCDLLDHMSVNLKRKHVIFSIQSYCGGKLVKLVAERDSYNIGGLLTEGRKGLTMLISMQELSGCAP